MLKADFLALPIFSQKTSLPDPLDSVLSVASFDLKGLPLQYFITEDNPNLSWVQTAFQTLGLRSLLCLDNFDHLIVHGQNYCILIVQQPQNYVAFLLPAVTEISDNWTEWARAFSVDRLQESDRFQIG